VIFALLGSMLLSLTLMPVLAALLLPRRMDEGDPWVVRLARLVYEFTGNPCDGFSSRFRLVTRITNTDGTARVTDMRTTSYEDGGGATFDFVNQNLVDGRKIEETKGLARRDGPTTRVTGAAAEPFAVAAAAKFPTEHMVAILEAARAGKRVLEIDLYDGSDGGRKPFRTTVLIGEERSGPDDIGDERAAAVPALTEGKRRWPVEISYFDPSKTTGEATPEYQLGFLLYENGVSRRLRLDYGDFAIAGTLSSLDALPTAACK
jgi:hypothetical protein